ncbi:MAG: hypothetical protein R2831_03880 [Chitinophagaceae bacterium]
MFHVYNLKQNTGLSITLLAVIFVLKIISGCINLYVHEQEYLTNDISFYHAISMQELAILQKDPMAFFREWLFNWGDIVHHLNIFSKANTTYWSNIGTLFHQKFMTLSNLFTFGHTYVNIIFYNVFFFIGQLLLYKVFYLLQPQKKYYYLFFIFLVPSILFWCSGVHKEGWILFGVGLLTFCSFMYHRSQQVQYLLFALLALFFIAVIRYFYFFVLVFPFVLYILSASTKLSAIRLYTISYFVLLIMFFSIKYISPSIDPMRIVQNRQETFFELRGYSDMQTPKLENNTWSYIKNLPTALNHIFLRPYFHAYDPVKYKVAALDTYLIAFCLGIFLFLFKRIYLKEPLYVFLLFFSLSSLLFIGYTIPNCGALVRYKSEFMAILLACMVSIASLKNRIPFIR